MKRIFSIVLALAVVFAFSGCGSSDAKVTLGEYKGLSAEKKVYELTQDIIDEYIESDLEGASEDVTVDGPAAKGNGVYLYFTVSSGDEVIEDNSEDGFPVYLGDGDYGDEFDEKLIGAKAGDHLTFTADYFGEQADFDVTVDSVFNTVIPKYTDKFIKDMGYSSKAEYEKEVKESLEAEMESESLHELMDNLFSQIVDTSTFENTEELLKKYVEDYKNYYTEYASMFGLDYEGMLEAFGMTEEDVSAEAEAAMKVSLVAEKIAEAEGIELTDDEVDEIVAQFAEDEGYESAEAFLEENGEDDVKSYILQERVFEFLIENSNITEVKAKYEGYDE